MNGNYVTGVIKLLVRKCEKNTIFFVVQYKDQISALVESTAMEDWMLVAQNIITPLKRPQLDCTDCWLGDILPNKE